ncbi:MAG TPA: 2-oxoglutarate dehydrogenase complex dihydrolipoyllysine-residue succinyltransferase [Alphaproteobacteria bacterium]
MSTDIKVPTLGESVTEATVAQWFKKIGDTVALDEPLVELETDKVTLEVNAQSAGTLSEILADTGANVEVGALLGRISDGAAAKPATKAERPAPAAAKPAEAKPAEPPEAPLSPAVRKLVAEHAVDTATVEGTGKDGRLTKGDVLAHLEARATPVPAPVPTAAKAPEPPAPAARAPSPDRREERVRMTRLRRRIAERLKEAQNSAAMLTTFNEADMTAVMDARKRFGEAFEKKHGVRLGFMSFFVKASIAALKEIPAVNAEIDGEDIVYRHYCDVGVAVGTEQGLVVPVLRNADRMSFAEIEKAIETYGRKARDGKLVIEDLTGGTFTISNGGVYGSLLSTPILNPPQSGILGMHKIEKRPVVRDDAVVVRPMMYLALSYDHRIVDGREAVTFLIRIKSCIEDPERLLFDV